MKDVKCIGCLSNMAMGCPVKDSTHLDLDGVRHALIKVPRGEIPPNHAHEANRDALGYWRIKGWWLQ